MQPVNFALLFLSITLEAGKNVLSARFSKESLKSDTDIYKFYVFNYLASFAVLLLFGHWEVSGYTALMALAFALVIAISQFFSLRALAIGPMSFTTFIQGSSLVIPTLVGAFIWHERISVYQLILIAVLIWAMALALNAKGGTFHWKWFLYTVISALFCGGIGVLQTVHQLSEHSGELFSFLRLAFLFSVVFNLILWPISARKTPSNFSIRSGAALQALATGVFWGCVHAINLYLAGAMPKVIFFPTVNGGLIFLSLIASLVFFGEKLTRRQWVGVVIGTVALSLIGLV